MGLILGYPTYPSIELGGTVGRLEAGRRSYLVHIAHGGFSYRCYMLYVRVGSRATKPFILGLSYTVHGHNQQIRVLDHGLVNFELHLNLTDMIISKSV